MALPPTSAADSLEYFRQHGVYYLEDAVIGSIVKDVDDRGLSTSPESWQYFKDVVLGNAVRLTSEHGCVPY